MATGGLHTCPKCSQRVRNADWLNGACRQCGLKFGEMDPDALAAEIERQDELRQRLGWSPRARALAVWAVTTMTVAIWIAQTAPANSQLKFFFEGLLPSILAGSVPSFGAWAGACQARYKKWSSGTTWVATIVGAIIPPILILVLTSLAFLVNSLL